MRTFKDYKKRVLFLCRDWEKLPSDYELKQMWYYRKRMN